MKKDLGTGYTIEGFDSANLGEQFYLEDGSILISENLY